MARAWVHVQGDAIRENYVRIVESIGPGANLLPMVKADAYGLGVSGVVACLDPLDPWGYGVAAVQEGVELRRLGVDRPIVVCSPTPLDEMATAVEAELQISVSSTAALRHLASEAAGASRCASWHLDIDTGLGRSGFDWRTADVWFPEVARRHDALHWVGCYTHLHSADENAHSVEQQWNRFTTVLDRIDRREDLLMHVLNSAGAFRCPAAAQSLVRPGIFLYGGEIGDGQPTPRPAASVHARVVHVRDAPAGTTVGYGSTYAATTDERWATLSIGYGDGIPRALSNRGRVLVMGELAPIIGRISMDVTVVDISGISGVEEGTVATLIGEQGGRSISVDDVAAQAGTISYEVLTGLTARLPRIWATR
jgi:alanine racemase